MTVSQTGISLRARVRQLLRSQFLLFILVGGMAATANFTSRIVISHWMPYPTAVALAFGVGVVTAFVLNKLFVFKGTSRSINHQMTWFAIVNLFGLAQTLAVSVLLVRYVFPSLGFEWHAESIAHMIGIVVPLVSSYFGHKHLSFRH